MHHARTHTCMHACTHTHAHTCTHTHTHIHTHTHMQMHMCTHTHTHTHTHYTSSHHSYTLYMPGMFTHFLRPCTVTHTVYMHSPPCTCMGGTYTMHTHICTCIHVVVGNFTWWKLSSLLWMLPLICWLHFSAQVHLQKVFWQTRCTLLYSLCLGSPSKCHHAWNFKSPLKLASFHGPCAVFSCTKDVEGLVSFLTCVTLRVTSLIFHI